MNHLLFSIFIHSFSWKTEMNTQERNSQPDLNQDQKRETCGEHVLKEHRGSAHFRKLKICDVFPKLVKHDCLEHTKHTVIVRSFYEWFYISLIVGLHGNS